MNTKRKQQKSLFLSGQGETKNFGLILDLKAQFLTEFVFLEISERSFSFLT